MLRGLRIVFPVFLFLEYLIGVVPVVRTKLDLHFYYFIYQTRYLLDEERQEKPSYLPHYCELWWISFMFTYITPVWGVKTYIVVFSPIFLHQDMASKQI
jgi:hypothetical protein